MKKMNHKILTALSVSSILILSACEETKDDMQSENTQMSTDMMTDNMTDTMTNGMTDSMTDTSMDMTYTYKVEVTNLTQGQPMSPFALIAHDEGMLFNIGEEASLSLEYIAEGGDTSMLLNEDWAMYSTTADAMLMPGETATLMLNDLTMMPKYLTLTSMLVATNDGFTGVNAFDTSMLMPGESYTLMGKVYDAGTEVNSELAGTIPGIDSGEGFNSQRVDSNIVTMHPGVVSMYDGLSQSVLTSHHRFDNPAIKVVITAMQ